MVKPDVVYHFDFGSPNSYLLHKLIPGIEQRTGVTFDYLPILLGGLAAALLLTALASIRRSFGQALS